MAPPNWVKLVCAAIAAIAYLGVYLAPMYPTVVYWLGAAEGTLVAVGLYLGWPVPAAPPTPPAGG